MVDIELMMKALRLAWIPRLLSIRKCKWKTVPDHYFRKYGGLNFLLRCNYGIKYLEQKPTFYKDILVAFDELKSTYSWDNCNDLILFNNKEILISRWKTNFSEGVVFQRSTLHNGYFE